MNGYQNPVNYLRRLKNALKGLKKAAQWRMYLAVAFLSIALSMIFVLHTVFWGREANTIERLPSMETRYTTSVTSPAAEQKAEPVREKTDQKSEMKAEVKPEIEKKAEQSDQSEHKVQAQVEKKLEAETKTEQKSDVETRPARSAKQSGEWYYDKVYKEWRFKRN